MTDRTGSGLVPDTLFIAGTARQDRTASVLASSSDTSGDSMSDDLRVRLGSLQELICELLFKNQQLRMALLQAKSEAGDSRIHIE